MATDFSTLLAAVAVLAICDLSAIASVIVFKAHARRRYGKRMARMKRLNLLVGAADFEGLGREFAREPDATLAHVRTLLEELSPGGESAAGLSRFLASVDLVSFARKRLRSAMVHARIDGYMALGLCSCAPSQELLVEGLARERRPLARLVALGRIARHPVEPDFRALVAALESGNPRGRRREVLSLKPLGPRLRAHFEREGLPEGEAGILLFLMSARIEPTAGDWERLARLADSRDDQLGTEAVAILAEGYASKRFLDAFGQRTERRFRIATARILGRNLDPEGLALLDPWFADPELREAGIAAAASILELHPNSEGRFLSLIGGEDHVRSLCLSRAIEHRLPSLLFHATLPLGRDLGAMVECLLEESRTGILLEALTVRLPRATREALLELLRGRLASHPEASAFLSRHVEGADAEALALAPPPKEEDRPQIPMGKRDKLFLVSLALLALAFFPAVFAILRAKELSWLSPPELLYRFVFDFQYLFAYYTIAVNASYLILLLLSLLKLGSQARLWERSLVRSVSGGGILPAITVLAPAYNEESTIVESVHSLLSLAYPACQIVVVNDGSSDGTMSTLARTFDLVPAPAGAASAAALPTMPVRTVYGSATVPNLLVVDKANGGKADALNAGLNLAAGDYVCTIDADSVLDPASLTRAMLQVLASDRPVIAMGGNVFPINGCVVEHGHLQDISLPDQPLARFQTVEYLRSFVAGRLGWTILDGLLIISGAFGIFDRKAVMEVGGYLTGRGSHRNETVGEDMEIVVRLTRKDREERRGGKVDYAYNANCWTEVPETWPSLRKQRDRWHRGLMEVLSFHRSMAFKARFGAVGLVAMPYLFLFELIGPWLEALGYFVLLVALVANLIDPLVPLVVFGLAVGFGILISVASLLLAERQILYFRPLEFFKLLGIAILENFGFRQVMSAGRVWSNIQFFFVRKGWQKIARRGFAKGPAR